MKIAFVLAAAVAVDTTTVVSGNLLRDPKTIVQKENRGLTKSERRLAVSVLVSHGMVMVGLKLES